ncbi:MAG: hypothetical protein ABFS24_06650, partial [Pseudomonadota bacterium]
IIVLLLNCYEYFGINWEPSPSNGWGRIIVYPEVAFSHFIISLFMLIAMLHKTIFTKMLLVVLGISAVSIGLYSFWWPGPIATAFPLSIGGMILTLNSIRTHSTHKAI